MPEPTWRDVFLEANDFDRYANLKWLGHIVEHANEEERTVFGHLLTASRIWVSRLNGITLTERPQVPFTREAIDDLHADWIKALNSVEFDRIVEFKMFSGDPHSLQAGDIIRHAQGHGIYHRGQIRESFGHRGLDFPDTDFLDFVWDRKEGLVN